MGIIRKPSEIEAKQTISMLIYGQPGAGKTTLGMSAPSPVLFDYDGGVSRINAAHQGLTVQVRSWEDTQGALDEIKADLPEVRTIVIDTVGKMLDFMSESIMRNNTRMRKPDGTLSLQGYGLRKVLFIVFIRQVSLIGRNVVFIAHEKEEKRGDDMVKRPEVGGSSANDLIKELDLVGYVQMIGRERTISFNPTEWYYAKNTCGLDPTIKIPDVLDTRGRALPEGNTFLAERVIAKYIREQEENRELTAKYAALMEAVDTAVKAAGTVDQLNEVKESIKRSEPIFNSQIAAAAKLSARAEEIGAKFDKIAGVYVQA